MNRYIVFDGSGDFWCEIIDVKGDNIQFWSSYDESKKHAIKFNRITVQLQIFLMRSLGRIEGLRLEKYVHGWEDLNPRYKHSKKKEAFK